MTKFSFFKKALMAVMMVGAFLAGTCLQNAVAQDHSTLIIGAQDIKIPLEPLDSKATSASGFRLMDNIFDKLFTVGDDGRIVPGLALSAERTDDLTWIVRLRKGVLFQDGSAFSAEDVAFTFGPERMLNKGAPGHNLGMVLFPLIKGVEVVDSHTVRFHTKVPDPVFVQRFTGYGAGIICKSAYQAAPDYGTWAKKPIGTGPFMISDIKENEYVLLKAFDAYWGGRPNVDAVKFQVVPELSARIAGLLAGDYDIITNVSPDQINVIEKNKGVRVVGGSTMGVRTLVYDSVNNPVLKDPRIRRAMNLAIDRQLIVKTIWNNRVNVPPCHQDPSFGALYDQDRGTPEYNPDKARQLIAAAGYNGQPILLKSVGNYYTAEMAETQALAAMFKAVGLNVQIKIVENWSQVYEQPRAMNNSSDSVFFPDPLAGFWPRWGGAWTNRGYWRNEEFLTLGKILSSSLDVNVRKKTFEKMLDIWCEQDPPGTVLHYLDGFYARSNRINWEPTANGLMDLRPDALSFN